MYVVWFNEDGENLGPRILCEQCRLPIEDMDTSIFSWRTPVDTKGVQYVPAMYLHQNCIAPYAKRHKKPYGEWNGVKISELASQDATIYTIDPERLESK